MTARQLTSSSLLPCFSQAESSGPQTASRSLRQQMRQYRRQITPFQQRHAAYRLQHRISQHSIFQSAHHIAFYLPNDGEISTWPLLRQAWNLGKCCYLPVMHPLHPGRLLFVRTFAYTRLYRNRWGIHQPRPRTALLRAPDQLDLVLVPLVAFDETGGRIGMGKGYYDRCFSFRRRRQGRPFLLGVAHEEQKITDTITPAPWDVPMDAIATPHAWYQRRGMFNL